MIITIDGMAQGGEGVGRADGYVVFVAGALPGERVRVAIQKQRSSYARGTLQEILTSSPDRIVPRLPGADHIPWQHIAYEAQLRFKQMIISEQLRKIARIPDPPVAAMLPADNPWNYRNRTTLHGSGIGKSNRIGYYATGSHHIQEMRDDPLLLPILNEILSGLWECLSQGTWGVQRVTLRANTYGDAMAMVQGTGPLSALANLWQQRVPRLRACLIGRSYPFADNPELADSASRSSSFTFREELGGIAFILSPDSFFQVHTAQAERLLEVVREGLRVGENDRVLDAYGGVGTFALPSARLAREVVVVEAHAPAIADGKETAHQYGLSNVQFLEEPVERALPKLREQGEYFTRAILDPPRRGCHPAALQALAAIAPARIVYVSCHPGVLARDVRLLLDSGYQLVSVQPVDMFPQTPHIEAVALLTTT